MVEFELRENLVKFRRSDYFWCLISISYFLGEGQGLFIERTENMSSISNAMGIDLFPDTYVSSNHPTHVGFSNQRGIGLFRTYVSRFLHMILCIYLIRRVGQRVTSVVLGILESNMMFSSREGSPFP